MFNANSKSNFFFIQDAAKNLNDGGAIISIVTSLLGAFTGFYSVYQGSKAPVEWFTKAAAKELQPRGIRVNAIAPGPMDTPFFYGQESPEVVAYHKSNGIGGRLTDIKDIAPLVDYLLTDKWITGQTLFCKSPLTSVLTVSQRWLHYPLSFDRYGSIASKRLRISEVVCQQ